MFSIGLSALIAANDSTKVVAAGCSQPDAIPVVLRLNPESSFSQMLASGTQPEATQLIVTLDAKQGNPENVTLSHSSGFSGLDAAAVSAARSAVFAPEMRGCTPIGGSYFLTIQY